MRTNNFMFNKDGLFFGMFNEVIMATTHNENNKDIVFYVNEDDCLDLFSVENFEDLIDELESSRLSITLKPMLTEVYNEASVIKLPIDFDNKLKGIGANDRIEMMNNNKVDHINLWIHPYAYEPDKYSQCWIWVELPKEIDDIKYVPIIVHKSGGVSVHPYYHKYFLRSFTKRIRHLILGFCYVHGDHIEVACNNAFKANRDEIREISLKSIRSDAAYYKDSDAPKRINATPKKGDPYYKDSIDDYDRWVKSLKD